MTLIKHISEYNKIIGIIPELLNDEVYIVELSARNKYLSPEERLSTGLTRTLMLSRETARSKESINYAIQRLEASLQYRQTDTRQPIPEKSLVIYIGINPSSMIDAYQNFKKELDAANDKVVKSLLNKNEPDFNPFLKAQSILMSKIQAGQTRKVWVDIDVDTKEPRIINEIKEFLNLENITYHVVETFGGFHVLVNRSSLRKGNQLYQTLTNLNTKDAEVCFCKSGLLPLPGTMQSDHLIKFV